MSDTIWDKMAAKPEISADELTLDDYVLMIVHSVDRHKVGDSRTIKAFAGIVQKLCLSNPDIKL